LFIPAIQVSMQKLKKKFNYDEVHGIAQWRLWMYWHDDIPQQPMTFVHALWTFSITHSMK